MPAAWPEGQLWRAGAWEPIYSRAPLLFGIEGLDCL